MPEIVTKDRVDRLSAKGYSFGYVGSVILLIFNLIMFEAASSAVTTMSLLLDEGNGFVERASVSSGTTISFTYTPKLKF